LKRIIDIVISLIGLILSLPILLFVSILVKLDTKESVFFVQRRPGKEGKIFNIYKFRTMKSLTDERANLLPDEKRISKTGVLLRRLSLDELPELWNVLKGDMSIVGPRPLVLIYLDRYTPDQARRHEVRPGITGWAQVNGRNAITWEEKFKFDIWYVDNYSLWLDFRIIFMTIINIIKGEGINQPGHATMEEFKGSGKEP